MTIVLPSYDDPVVSGAVEAIGGPPGRHAWLGGRRFWTPVRVLIVLTLLTCAFGWLQKAPCRNGSAWVEEYQYTRACYTDVVALYSAERLSSGATPYYDHPVEYPVLTGAMMQISALLAEAVDQVAPDDKATRDAKQALERAPDTAAQTQAASALSFAEANARGRHFYDVTWVLLTLCALVVTVTTARLAGRRVWDAALFALAPALVLHGTTNWDLLAMALAGAGLLAWARARPVAAGVLLGLATATKLYPVLFLVPLFFLCLRATRLKQWAVTALALVVTAAGVTLPVYLTAPSFTERNGAHVRALDSPLERFSEQGLAALAPHQRLAGGGEAINSVYRFFELNQTRGADWDSLYLQVQRLRTEDGLFKALRNGLADVFTDTGPPPPNKLNLFVACFVLFVMAGIGALALRAPRRPRLPQLLFLTLVGFLLVNKVNSPQYVLWLIPLAVLARPRWRPFLAWMAAEALVLGARFAFFIGNDKPGEGIDIGWFFAAVLLRDAVLVTLAAFVVRDILHPERDVVRRSGVDDPAGGVLDGSPDRAPKRPAVRQVQPIVR